jgi:hypothetical protein
VERRQLHFQPPPQARAASVAKILDGLQPQAMPMTTRARTDPLFKHRGDVD